MRVIEIVDHEASERDLTPREREDMLGVQEKLRVAINAAPVKKQLENTPPTLHHLVYLANVELFRRGNRDLEFDTG